VTKSGPAPIAEHVASVILSETSRLLKAEYPLINVQSINGIFSPIIHKDYLLWLKLK
jgi:hypothetical protein